MMRLPCILMRAADNDFLSFKTKQKLNVHADSVGAGLRLPAWASQLCAGRLLWAALGGRRSVSSIEPGHPGMECSALPARQSALDA